MVNEIVTLLGAEPDQDSKFGFSQYYDVVNVDTIDRTKLYSLTQTQECRLDVCSVESRGLATRLNIVS